MSGQLWLNMGLLPRARNEDPETSHQAAKSVKERTVTELHRWILSTLRWEVSGGMTDEELQVFHSISYSSKPPPSSNSGLRTRRCELVRMGLVEEVGRSKTKGGRSCIVWGLVKKS